MFQEQFYTKNCTQCEYNHWPHYTEKAVMMAGVEYDFSVMYPKTNFSNENVMYKVQKSQTTIGLAYCVLLKSF